MEAFRIANLIEHALYLPLNLGFILLLIKNRQPTPVWKWFLFVVTGLWIMVTCRFVDGILYAFYENNSVYRAEVGLQLISTTIATSSYLIWNLYLIGKDQIAKNKFFRAGIIAVSTMIVLVIGSDFKFHLFYKQLEMYKEHEHGVMWIPCFLGVYGTLFAGWLISVINIVKRGTDKVKQIIVFSLYPFGPAIAGLVRSITKVDEFDLTPVVMTISVLCLYSIVFKNNYVNVIPQSMKEALDQTDSGIVLINSETGAVEYCNRVAGEKYSSLMAAFSSEVSRTGTLNPARLNFSHVSVSVREIQDEHEVMAVISDLGEINRKQIELNGQIEKTNVALLELSEKRKNIDAYLQVLYEIPHLKEKYELFTKAEEAAQNTFVVMEKNLKEALNNPGQAEAALNNNMELATETITTVRLAVSKLKEV